MPSVSMPQRQTYPYLIGEVRDQVGLLPLEDAEELILIVQDGEDGDIFELTATTPVTPTTFLDSNNVERTVSFIAPIGTSGLSDTVTIADLESKLKITWAVGEVQYAPKNGFITIAITRNVRETP